MANNQRFLSSLVLDHGKLWEKSKGLALPRLEQRGTPQWSLNDIPKQKNNESSNEKHTHRNRFSLTMPRTSFPGQNCANGLFQTADDFERQLARQGGVQVTDTLQKLLTKMSRLACYRRCHWEDLSSCCFPETFENNKKSKMYRF